MIEPSTTVFGGTGFLGTWIVERLNVEGQRARVAVRTPERWASRVEAVDVMRADIRDDASVAAAVEGATAVVNAASLYAERGPLTFEAIHEDGAERVAKAAARAGASWLVHVSGIGAEPDAPSRYARSRARGEARVRLAFPDATIVRPSVMVGPNDALVAPLARLARLMPAIPVFGGGTTRLQPVLVDDVANAIAAIVVSPDARGAIYELGGPGVYTFAEIVRLVLARSGRRRPLVPVPFVVGEAAAALLGLLPNPPVTVDAIRLLRSDNVVGAGSRGFAHLGITPTSFEDAVARSLVVVDHLGSGRSAGSRQLNQNA